MITNGYELKDLYPEKLPKEWFLKITPNLFFSRRNNEVLIVEPDSASWLVLDDARMQIFQRLQEYFLPGNISPSLLKVGQVPYRDILAEGEFYHLLMLLFHHNMISINGNTYYEPDSMWNVQEYPHYFNIHITESCNLACKYCRINSKPDAPRMNTTTCKRIVRRVIKEFPTKKVSISFHGGEPLLNLPVIVEGAKEALEVSQSVEKLVGLHIQTNGTLLSADLLAKLQPFNVDIGVSIDGPPQIHNQYRVYHNGNETYQNVCNGIKIAQDMGFSVGFLAVVHDPKNYVEVLDHLVHTFKKYSIRLNYSALEGRAKKSLNFPIDRSQQFAREWIKIFDYAVHFKEETGIVLNISDLDLFIFHLISKQRPHMCYRSPCGIGNSILGFNTEGNIYLCDEMVGEEGFCIGDIYDDRDLKEQLDNSQIKKTVMASRETKNINKCSSCAWKNFHGTGCANKSFRYFDILGKEDPMCRFYSIIFENLMWRIWDNPELICFSSHYLADSEINDTIKNLKQQKTGEIRNSSGHIS